MRYRVEYVGTIVGRRTATATLAEAGVQFDPQDDVTRIDETTDEIAVVIVPSGFGSARPPAVLQVSAHKPGTLAQFDAEGQLAHEPLSRMEVAVEQWGKVKVTLSGLMDDAYDLLIATGWSE